MFPAPGYLRGRGPAQTWPFAAEQISVDIAPNICTLSAVEQYAKERETVAGVGNVEVGQTRPGKSVRKVDHARSWSLQLIPSLGNARLHAGIAIRQLTGIHASIMACQPRHAQPHFLA